MNNILSFKRGDFHQALINYSIIFLTLLSVSCSQESKTSGKSESELIIKVNAVQQQIMKQGNLSEEEKQAILSLASLVSHNDGFESNYLTDAVILFKDIENAPIYNGCEGLSEEGTKKCFNESISKFIKQEFNSSITNALDTSEPQQVAAFFIINENGNLSDMKIRDAELIIQGEIGRVLKKIPKMKPATQDGINVPVLCSILVTYGSEIKIELMYIPHGLTKN